MALQDTGLIISAAQLPATFKGTPQDLFAAMLQRMKIVSATGSNFFVVGDSEPSSNSGPWLKGGTQWWVFSPDLKRYVPLDIGPSEKTWYHIGNSVPTGSVPPVWLKTTKDATDSDISVGDPISWHVFDGTNWVPFTGIVDSGTTTQRPGAPVEYQQYYDTTISCLIWWERAQWRTVSGVPGDVKNVAFEILTDALTNNPGWSLFGDGNQAFRGRLISGATKDPGGSPATDLTTDANVAHRASFETFGTTLNFTPGAGTVPVPSPSIALWTLVKT